MASIDELRADFAETLEEWGAPIRIKYYIGSVSGDDYDDAQELTKSGNDTWASGVIATIDQTRGSYDALLLEQGKVQINDKKIYIKHDITTSGTFKIGIGSPVQREYALTEGGVIVWEPLGEVMYKKIYVKQLTTGSFSGE